jgi:hypothetical protein
MMLWSDWEGEGVAAGGGVGTYTTCGPVCLFGQPPKITAILKTAAFQLKMS